MCTDSTRIGGLSERAAACAGVWQLPFADDQVVTQFCFNPFKLLRWLTRTHSAMEA